MNSNNSDIVIIGGGIMGLMTAYYSSLSGARVTMLEKGSLINPSCSSNGLTRSIRQDYLDPFYSKLAFSSYQLWKDLQNQCSESFLIECGCLNINNSKIIADQSSSYAAKSNQVLESLSIPVKSFTRAQLKSKFSQFNADYASLNSTAGLIYTPPLYRFLLQRLNQNKVTIIQEAIVTSIETGKVQTKKCAFSSNAIVLTPGRWINDLLRVLKSKDVSPFPLSLTRPIENKYYIPRRKSEFSFKSFPVFAYLDIGIYGHPIVSNLTPGVKIGCYNPFSTAQMTANIDTFIATCIPGLVSANSLEITDYDLCYYDNTPDSDFILGPLPKSTNIYVGSGWCGTGYKFAPLVGKVLAALALAKPSPFVINRFRPDRF